MIEQVKRTALLLQNKQHISLELAIQRSLAYHKLIGPLTLEEIAYLFSVSKQRIVLILQNALGRFDTYGNRITRGKIQKHHLFTNLATYMNKD